MSDKKSNIIYIVFSIIVVIALIFFIAIPVMRNSKEKRNSIDYNTKGKVGEYDYKISNATYIKDTKELYFVFSTKFSSSKFKENGVIKPKITSIELTCTNEKGKETTEDLTKKATEEKRSDISKYITIPNVSDKYLYVKVTFESTVKAYDEPDTIDEFGDTIKGKHHKKETSIEYVMFDHEDIKVTTSEKDKKARAKFASELKEKNEDKTLSDDESKSDFGDETIVVPKKKDDSSEVVETIITTPAATQASTKKAENESEKSSEKATTTRKVTANNNGGYSGGNGGYSGGNQNYNYDNQEDNYSNDYNNDYNYNQDNNDYQQEQRVETTQDTTKQTTEQTTKETEPAYVNARGLKIECDFENNKVVLNVGDSTQLKAVISPDNANNKSVEWESNREDIATVDENGKVKAVGKGKAIIVVKSVENSSVTASIMITVN